MARLRVLLTGFGPFPGASENISEWLVQSLAATGPAPGLGCELHAEALPTVWSEVATLGPRLLDRHRPHLVVHLGLSMRARGFRIERSAHNQVAVREDASGALPLNRTISERGPAHLDTGLPAGDLARHLRDLGLPATVSRSAGSYLCNLLYYLSLDWAARQKAPCEVCFVHVPPGGSQGGPLGDAELLRGTEAALRYLVAAAGRRDGIAAASSKLAPVLLHETRSHGETG
jgi:pyroglutamyl-peptidase